MVRFMDSSLSFELGSTCRVRAKIRSVLDGKILFPLESDVVVVAQDPVAILSQLHDSFADISNSLHGIKEEGQLPRLIGEVNRVVYDIESALDVAATSQTSDLSSRLSALLAQISSHLRAFRVDRTIREITDTQIWDSTDNAAMDGLRNNFATMSDAITRSYFSSAISSNSVRRSTSPKNVYCSWENLVPRFSDIVPSFIRPVASATHLTTIQIRYTLTKNFGNVKGRARASRRYRWSWLKCHRKVLNKMQIMRTRIPPAVFRKNDYMDIRLIREFITSSSTTSTTLKQLTEPNSSRRLLHRYLELESDYFNHKFYLKQLERSKEILRLFPRDHEFDKQQLVHLWIADKLAEPEHAEKLLDACYESLVSEQYILLSNSSPLYKLNSEKVNFDSKINPRYHILDPQTKHEPTPADILHISVQDDDIDDSLVKALENNRRLGTLLFNSNQSLTLEKMLMEIFMNCESLLVLDLSGTAITELPSSLAKMTRLRYLDLSWTLIELLPESICSFEDLETLRLNGCSNIWKLPRDFKRLTKLKQLEFDVLGNLASMPEGIGSLVNIQTLSAFLVGTQEGCKIIELEKLNSINGEFCVANLENVKNVEDAKASRLQDKKHIKTLELRWTDASLQDGISYGVLETLSPHTELEELQIQLYSGKEFPKWIGDDAFHKLSSITLFKCEHVLVLPSLQKLPSLEYLRLFCLVSVIELDFCCEKGGIGFPKLQTVIIENMLVLKEWKVSDGDDFPCLVELTIKDCPELSKVPELVYHSSTLKFLMVEDCPEIKKSSLEEGFYDKLKHIQDVCIVQDDDEEDNASCCESVTESDDTEVVYKDGYEAVTTKHGHS